MSVFLKASNTPKMKSKNARCCVLAVIKSKLLIPANQTSLNQPTRKSDYGRRTIQRSTRRRSSSSSSHSRRRVQSGTAAAPGD
jgi:hypothetical protein